MVTVAKKCTDKAGHPAAHIKHSESTNSAACL